MTIASRRRSLPPGTVAVAASVGIAGLASYGFMVVSARALGSEAYAPLSVMWVLTILIGPGLFLPVEQELARALATRAAHRTGSRRVVVRAATLAASLLGVIALATTLARHTLTAELFHGQDYLVAALVIALVGYGGAHLTKGVLAGVGHFHRYARFTAGDALARLGIVVVLALVGARSPAPYGFAVAAAIFVGILAALWGSGRLMEPGPPPAWRELGASLGGLLAASLLSLGLANVGPVAVQLLSEDADSDAVASFLLALVVARVPLFLFQAIQAGLVPRIATLASNGLLSRLRRELSHMIGIVATLGAIGVIVAGLAGPALVRLLFGPEFRVGGRTMVLLALSSTLFMVAAVVAQAAIALGGQAGTAWAWGLALLSFGVALFVPVEDLYLRVELASVISCAVALLGQVICFSRRLEGYDAPVGNRPETVS